MPNVLKIAMQINQIISLFLAAFHRAINFHTKSHITQNKISGKSQDRVVKSCCKLSISIKFEINNCE